MESVDPSRHFQCLALDILSYINGALSGVNAIFGGCWGGYEGIKGNKDNEFLLVEGMTVGVVHTQKIKRETSARCQAFVFGVWQRQIIWGGRSWGEGGFEYSLLWSED